MKSGWCRFSPGTKNNPALIGEPGVGKTAIVEASRNIMNKEVPEILYDKARRRP
jgi:ATP-dependent Clp protease ATP-binding subunit ClpA